MKKRRTPRMGRPPEFTHRVRLQVFLERSEVAAIKRAAKAAGLTASRFARQALLAAAKCTEEDSHAR